jgi:hypothetical protein
VKTFSARRGRVGRRGVSMSQGRRSKRTELLIRLCRSPGDGGARWLVFPFEDRHACAHAAPLAQLDVPKDLMLPPYLKWGKGGERGTQPPGVSHGGVHAAASANLAVFEVCSWLIQYLHVESLNHNAKVLPGRRGSAVGVSFPLDRHTRVVQDVSSWAQPAFASGASIQFQNHMTGTAAAHRARFADLGVSTGGRPTWQRSTARAPTTR